jgi:hypothetical protein
VGFLDYFMHSRIQLTEKKAVMNVHVMKVLCTNLCIPRMCYLSIFAVSVKLGLCGLCSLSHACLAEALVII